MDTCPRHAVESMIRCLARLHAGLWGAGETRRETPAPEMGDLLTRWRGHLAAGDLELLARVAANQEELRSRLSPATTLCHGDFHPLNVLVGESGAVALDWQDCHQGNPAEDLALFLGAYVHPLDRRRFEPAWLRVYHEELTALGVAGYEPADLMGDYRTGVVLALLAPIRLQHVAGLRPEAVLLRAKHLLVAGEEIVNHEFWSR
jgi:aminoglycoside phosphotransferase (APT) family kinase protein